MHTIRASDAPLAGTLECWAVRFLSDPDPLARLRSVAPEPASAPLEAELGAPPIPRHVVPPPRPERFRAAPRGRRSVGGRALASPAARARLLHTFLHHEVQAAELFVHAFLAFADAPADFRRGLLGIARDELRHARRYADLLAARGIEYGDLPVRDWFWARMGGVRTPASFLAWVGLGLEGANLDHTARFAARFEAAGDGEAARLVTEVGAEEIAHVRFAARWFTRFVGELDLASWRAALPPPFSPLPFVHRPIARAARARAGFPEALLDELDAGRV